jgi:hypothetical protein
VVHLHRRLFSLPTDIENIDAHILTQIDPEHKEEPSMIFQIFRASNNGNLDIMTLSRTLRCLDSNQALKLEKYPRVKIASSGHQRQKAWVHDKTVPALQPRCRALLEIGYAEDENDFKLRGMKFGNGPSDGSSALAANTAAPPRNDSRQLPHIRYLHRTARDYIEQRDVWQSILSRTAQARFDPVLELLIGGVVYVKQHFCGDTFQLAIGKYQYITCLGLRQSP